MPRCRSLVLFLMLAALVVAPLTGAASQRPSTEQLTQEAEQEVASMQKLSQEMVDSIFSFGELGFQEFWTVEYITGVLEAEGFDVEIGCAGRPHRSPVSPITTRSSRAARGTARGTTAPPPSTSSRRSPPSA